MSGREGQGYHEEYQVYLSYPAIVSREGAEIAQDDLQLSDLEKEKLNNVIEVLKKEEI